MRTPISFADLVGDEQAEVPVHNTRERRSPPLKYIDRSTREAARATELAARDTHLKVKSDPDLDPGEADADREKRIKKAIRGSLANRLALGVDPMRPKQLAVELAHFNMVHLSSHSTEILERVAEYARDPNSDHHEWALKFMAERAMPLKLMQEAQMDAAGLSERGATPKAPEVHIHVNAATPVRQSDIIDAIEVKNDAPVDPET